MKPNQQLVDQIVILKVKGLEYVVTLFHFK